MRFQMRSAGLEMAGGVQQTDKQRAGIITNRSHYLHESCDRSIDDCAHMSIVLDPHSRCLVFAYL